MSKVKATQPKPYRGRFAPSPTGNLHFGSLLAALVSFCEAKSQHGEWHLRIEDVDTTRAVKGAGKAIFKTLENYGLRWDGPVIYQSDQSQQNHYHHALERLTNKELTYRCGCSRKDLTNAAIYPGHCRLISPTKNKPTSIRVVTDNKDYMFADGYQGQQQQNLQQQCGDFNIKRKDGLYSYQLAVVIDDALSEINHVVRGIDIMDSTARQIYLQNLLGLPTPEYAHFPVVTTRDGAKLSKQNHAAAISNEDPLRVTIAALELLNQELPKTPMTHQKELISWAIDHWRPEKLKDITQLKLN